MARKKSEFLSAWGLAGEVFKGIVDAVLAAGGNDAHLLSLRGDKKRLASIAAIIVGIGMGDLAPMNLGDYYTAPVDYAPLPSRSELEEEFSGKDSVSVLFDGRPWQEHSSRAGSVCTPGSKDFFVKQFTAAEIEEMGGLESEKIIAWAQRNGLVPANHIEARAFAKANPSVQTKGWIVALGSFARDGDCDYVPVLRVDGGGRVFVIRWFDYGWGAGGRFLFVRK